MGETLPSSRRATMRMAELIAGDDLAQRIGNLRELLEWGGVLSRHTVADDIADLARGVDAFVASPPERSTLVLRAALACFQKHSQAGSTMVHSSSGSPASKTTTTAAAADDSIPQRTPTSGRMMAEKYINDDDAEVRELVSAAALLTERGVCVDGCGAYISG